MKISRLRLTGFKSFVEPTELRIEPGLTGVVGPNGCGKSNLLEAIRWVMGESSPKSMRSGSMDDVIFAGTVTQPARDFAEVALVCDSEGAALPGVMGAGDGGMLEVLRRIERGAGSAYRANGQDVRARDVALIFADAATGAHSPALVSQGKVAGIIAARPQDRRQLLEEAAGIAGFHVRRKEAEQKLRATEANLSRIADIIADMEGRAGALRRQARAAERYIRLSDQLRAAEARMIYARWRDAAVAADQARAEVQAAIASVDAAAAVQLRAGGVQAAAATALTSARDSATAQREAEYSLSARLARQVAERDALVQRVANLRAEHHRITQDRDTEDALLREAGAAIERLNRAVKLAAQQMIATGQARALLEAQSVAAADAVRDADVALAEARGHSANKTAERRIADAAIAEALRQLGRVEADIVRLIDERTHAGDERELASCLVTAQAELDNAQLHKDAAQRDLAGALTAREAAFADHAEADAARAEARASLTAVEREADALARSLAVSAAEVIGIIGAVRPQPGYEAALAAALGDDLTAPDLSGDRPGHRGWRGAAQLGDDPPLPAGTIALSAVVSAPAALLRRLAYIAVADDDDGAPLPVGQRLVTRDGRVRRWDGFVSVGDGAANAERLARANRLDTVSGQLPAIRSALETIAVRYAKAAAHLAATEQAVLVARGAVAALDMNDRTAQRARDDAEAALARCRDVAAYVDQRLTTADNDRAEARVAVARARQHLTELPDSSAAELQLQRCSTHAEVTRSALADLRERMAHLDRELARHREAQIEAQADIRGWTARIGEATRRITTMHGRLAQIDRDLSAGADRPAQMQGSIGALETEQATISLRLAQAFAQESRATDALCAADIALENAREALAEAREARAGAAARADHAESRRMEMGRISGERFACPPPLLPAQVGFVGNDVGSPQVESAGHERLTQDRERIGPVNLMAADELAATEAEQAIATTETTELQQAVNQLRGGIGHLNREGRQRLLDAFTQVDVHFRSLFATLFNGGQAHLALIESDDPLEAGLEIMAEPPGKRLSSLTLLSGGEQALTAIALIFALFLTNPAPICVLDEVDAPLDDANVERFCDLLDRMTRETATRYLIVTHNAVTMARMHRLFGVTMVEQGVSRLVSVDLGSAEELLAAE